MTVKEEAQDLQKVHLLQTLQSLQYIKSIQPPSLDQIASRSVKLPPYRSEEVKKTIIFDLDETLIHCVDDPDTEECDVIIDISFPTGEVIPAGINIRPFSVDCLRAAR